jgi:CheY-like chemotaxis protein
MNSILVVDDDADAREALCHFLSRQGYAPRTAQNGREALMALVSSVPDVIILDVRMPEMSGIEFLQVIRSYLRWSTLPVLMLTAYTDGPHIERARALQVRCVFDKSNYRLADLLQCVRDALTDPAASCGDLAGPKASPGGHG